MPSHLLCPSSAHSFLPLLSDHTISQFSFCILSAGSAHLLIPEALIKGHDSSYLTTRYHVKATMLSPLCVGTPGANCFTMWVQHTVGPWAMGWVNEQLRPALACTRGRPQQEN